jgi:signal transduction histidine kinase
MSGLTLRLLLSYVTLAILVLTGAGLLSYSLLGAYLDQANEGVRVERARTAARLATQLCQSDPQMRLERIAREVEQAVPGVLVVPYPPQETVSRPAMAEGAGGWDTDGYWSSAAFGDSCQLRVIPTAAPSNPAAALRAILLRSGGLALGLAVLTAVWFSRSLTGPLRRMSYAAGRLAEGEWETPLPTGGPTEIRDLSDAFRRMAIRLRGDFSRLKVERERLAHLAAEVAHELKTPVASLRAYFELLLDDQDEQPPTRVQLLRRGAAQVNRLEYLAHFLVEMARLEAPAAPVEREEVHLADLVRQTAATWGPLMARQGMTLKVTLGDERTTVLASVHRLGQALDNLLQNALRWSPPGGEVTLALHRRGDLAVLTVSDQGPGIPDELRSRLFEPFVKGPGSKGMGVGLAVVRAVAQSYGGTVTAVNRPGGGAEVVMTMPV